jgi:hypothetical protein
MQERLRYIVLRWACTAGAGETGTATTGVWTSLEPAARQHEYQHH